MLTLHRAGLLLPATATATAAPVPDGAVAVRDDRIAAVGPYEELAAAYPGARTRAWPGVLTPGLWNPHGRRLLEEAYHPDPREAAELGAEPLTGAALAALPMDEERWGASARRGLQRMLRYGTTALSGPFHRPAVRTAVARSGLTVVAGTAVGEPSLDPLRGAADPLAVLHGRLSAGARADLAVFDLPVGGGVRDPCGVLAALREGGAASCVATVLAGRLVHRRR